jgi:hypothetical protein
MEDLMYRDPTGGTTGGVSSPCTDRYWVWLGSSLQPWASMKMNQLSNE